jgi:hypothetical protein
VATFFAKKLAVVEVRFYWGFWGKTGAGRGNFVVFAW